ncbi:hypothetical protein ACFCX0_41025 [Streptomyces sp. NPDC056352]|uniref:hypothetical protein n=1 Tax=Streptomyces sp. NPDC056352 TaxID=3345791 RepID=UPI0035E0E087
MTTPSETLLFLRHHCVQARAVIEDGPESIRRAAALKCVYMALMNLDPTGKGRKRWTMRRKAPLNARSPSRAA